MSPVASRTVVFPHQVAACHAVVNRMDGRAILADEVGLGKTIEAGMVLTEYRVRGEAESILVVTPAGLTTQWQQELLTRFNVPMPIVDGKGDGEGSVAHLGDLDAAITSLPFAKREGVREEFQERKWDLVIVDEAHHLKNPATLNYKFVSGLDTRRLLLLTATPLQNSLGELFTLMGLVAPGSDRDRLGLRRFPKRLAAADAEVLRKRLSGTMIRSRRSDVKNGAALPPREARTLRVRLSGPGRDLYQAASGYAAEGYRKSAVANNAAYGFYLMGLQRMLTSSVEALAASLGRRLEMLEGLARLRKRDRRRLKEMLPEGGEAEELPAELKKRVVAEIETLKGIIGLASRVERQPKRRALVKFLRELFRREPDARVLVFTEFLKTQEMLASALIAEGWATEIYRGGMGIREKNEVIERFEKGRILVSTEAGAEGRNLQFCHVVVNFDLPWNPMRVEQRIGRVHRLGQTRDVLVVNLVATGTVEDHLLRILDEKLGIFRETVGDLETILGILSPEGAPETVVMEAFVQGHGKRGGLKGFAKALDESIEASGESLSHAFASSGIDLRPPHVDTPTAFPLYDDTERIERAFQEFLDKYNVLLDREGGVYRFKMPYFLSIGTEGLFDDEVRGTFSKEEALDKPWLHHISITHPFLVKAMGETTTGQVPVAAAAVGRERLAAAGLRTERGHALMVAFALTWHEGDREYEEVVSVATDGEATAVRPEVEEALLWAEEVPPAFTDDLDLPTLLDHAADAVGDYAHEEATTLGQEAGRRRDAKLAALEERAVAALEQIHGRTDAAHREIIRLEKEGDEEGRLPALKRRRAGLMGEGAKIKKQAETLKGLRRTTPPGLVKATATPIAALRLRVV